jgi:hypothetical protein
MKTITYNFFCKEEFEDTKGVMRIYKILATGVK